jgi:hypothetical protein
MGRLNLVLSPVLILFAGCSPAPQTPLPTDPLLGCWAGEDFQPLFQRKATWFMNRKADGTFTIEFAITDDGVHRLIQKEEGRWSHKDGIYTTLTMSVADQPVDTSDPKYTDTYEIISLADGVMKYYHPRMNMSFTSSKVPCERSAAQPSVAPERQQPASPPVTAR